IVWLPFDLHPEYPPEGIPLEQLHRRYGIGTGEDDPLRHRFASADLEYNRPGIVLNTRLALRMSGLARDKGVEGRCLHRPTDAYWSEATDIGDPDELRRLAEEVGLSREDVDRVIDDSSAYLDRVEHWTAQALSVGINAVPAFLLDRRLIVLGAQPLDAFR